ncbi:putative peptidoglycan lipid II flippase [Streptomyces sp. LamerLS-31b]|nr:putative peptidoglycan lipid II flippase [Streptomyces sp. LamerLS-31b]
MISRFLLPQIFFYDVFSIFSQVLNARNRFGAMVWTPVLNDLVVITMFGLYLGLMTAPEQGSDITDAQVRPLGGGATLALAIQALALIPYASAAGFRFGLRFDWRGTGPRKSVNAVRWTLLFVLANLVASAVVARLAFTADAVLPHDGVGCSAYSYAQQIWMLPSRSSLFPWPPRCSPHEPGGGRAPSRRPAC